jgi:putative membrane protein
MWQHPPAVWLALLVRFGLLWATNLLALWIANSFWDGVTISSTAGYLIGSFVLAFANAIVKPVLAILTLPLIVFTLGLFYLVINIAMVALAEWIAPDFSVDGFWSYVGVVAIVWIVNWAVNAFIERTVGARRTIA